MPGCVWSLQLALQNSAGHAPSTDNRKIFCAAIRFNPLGQSVILINLLKVKPGKQEALIALLKQNIDTVVRMLPGWKTTRLIAAKDGAGVVIYSEWENPAAVE
eukprot:gene30235-37394_t